MTTDNKTFLKRTQSRIHRSWCGRLFLDKKFAHYTWIGIFISLLNIFLHWLLIDILGVSTIISAIIVVGGTFIFRYILFDLFKVI